MSTHHLYCYAKLTLIVLHHNLATQLSLKMKYFRAYPSLNLTLHVSKDRQSVQCVLPGLRFDDIDHTGMVNFKQLKNEPRCKKNGLRSF